MFNILAVQWFTCMCPSERGLLWNTLKQFWPDMHHLLLEGEIHDKIKLEKVALDGSVECCAPPPRWCDLEL